MVSNRESHSRNYLQLRSWTSRSANTVWWYGVASSSFEKFSCNCTWYIKSEEYRSHFEERICYPCSILVKVEEVSHILSNICGNWPPRSHAALEHGFNRGGSKYSPLEGADELIGADAAQNLHVDVVMQFRELSPPRPLISVKNYVFHNSRAALHCNVN
ncbi:hypothetical protein TNCV_722611 [Trichonephila clavipes]|nr:hypothetical protein TNCV_722611 [Trichonephila clavipes]